MGASVGTRGPTTDFDGLLHPQARISFIGDITRVEELTLVYFSRWFALVVNGWLPADTYLYNYIDL